MVCRECAYMQSVGTNSLYVCMNQECEHFMEYTGISCEDECEDGKGLGSFVEEVG